MLKRIGIAILVLGSLLLIAPPTASAKVRFGVSLGALHNYPAYPYYAYPYDPYYVYPSDHWRRHHHWRENVWVEHGRRHERGR